LKRWAFARRILTKFDAISQLRYTTYAGWSSLVARRAHNPKVVSSNLTPATIQFVNAQRVVHQRQPFLLSTWVHLGAEFHPIAPQAAHHPLSWHQLAYRFFPSAAEMDIEKYESQVRRMYNRVAKKLPGSVLFKPPRLSKYDRIVLQAVMIGIIPVGAICDSNL
jgi:hypothetical protein